MIGDWGLGIEDVSGNSASDDEEEEEEGDVSGNSGDVSGNSKGEGDAEPEGPLFSKNFLDKKQVANQSFPFGPYFL